MKLIQIPEEKYSEYRLKLMFDAYKWDPQFLDSNTIAKHILILSPEEHIELKQLTESLDKETIEAEAFLNTHLDYAKDLALPKKIYLELRTMKNYDKNKHIRLMRYDFHKTTQDKWAISEVNSDVPGGFAEASLMPKFANTLFNDTYTYLDFSKCLFNSIINKVKPHGTIALVHCTSFGDDRQVMQFLGDNLEKHGYTVIYMAADHLRFKNNIAYSILDGNEKKIDFIFRFTPLEWLKDIKPKNWQGYFNTITTSCNHPIAIFAQTKRFPLVWNLLEKKGIILPAWKKLLPETTTVRNVHNLERNLGYIYKPACGRVGEKISIKEACVDDEYDNILEDVKKHPNEYVMQKKFSSLPFDGNDGKQYHICLGSYTVDGKHSGYYARISTSPRIDSNSADIPVLIERSYND